jgi:hypothetical protein
MGTLTHGSAARATLALGTLQAHCWLKPHPISQPISRPIPYHTIPYHTIAHLILSHPIPYHTTSGKRTAGSSARATSPHPCRPPPPRCPGRVGMATRGCVVRGTRRASCRRWYAHLHRTPESHHISRPVSSRIILHHPYCTVPYHTIPSRPVPSPSPSHPTPSHPIPSHPIP